MTTMAHCWQKDDTAMTGTVEPTRNDRKFATEVRVTLGLCVCHYSMIKSVRLRIFFCIMRDGAEDN